MVEFAIDFVFQGLPYHANVKRDDIASQYIVSNITPKIPTVAETLYLLTKGEQIIFFPDNTHTMKVINLISQAIGQYSQSRE